MPLPCTNALTSPAEAELTTFRTENHWWRRDCLGAETRGEWLRDLVNSPHSNVHIPRPIGPRGEVSAPTLDVRPGRLADEDKAAIPVVEPSLMLLYVGDTRDTNA